MRIVSLLPSNTELVCALGLREQLVGRSHECDFPASVETLPVCTASAIDAHGFSLEIDRDVKSKLSKAASLYELKKDLLQQLKPDVILTQSQCEVCAVSLEDVERAVCDLLGKNTKIVSLEPKKLSDLWADIEKVAAELGVLHEGALLISRLKKRVDDIHRKAKRLKARPRVACIEWLDPLMSGGNWMPELVEMAGGENLFGETGKHSPWLEWEELRKKDPDVIVILPCGFNMKRTLNEIPALARREGWDGLKAVREGRVYLADGNQYFNRPGPRLVESLEILAEIFHPETFQFHHEGTAWQRSGHRRWKRLDA